MIPAVALSPEDRRLVLQILAAHLPNGSTVWVFGSRATARPRRYSDLDLAIDAGRPLTLDEMAALAEAFSESDLAWRVDIVDWRRVDADFRQAIVKARVPLLLPTKAVR